MWWNYYNYWSAYWQLRLDALRDKYGVPVFPDYHPELPPPLVNGNAAVHNVAAAETNNPNPTSASLGAALLQLGAFQTVPSPLGPLLP